MQGNSADFAHWLTKHILLFLAVHDVGFLDCVPLPCLIVLLSNQTLVLPARHRPPITSANLSVPRDSFPSQVKARPTFFSLLKN